MNLSGWLLRLFRWRVVCTVPPYDKCIICVAPHTSNWDFILGELAYTSVGRKANFLMKESWFFFPLGALLKAIGGIPVSRGKGRSLTPVLIEKMNEASRLNLAVTPEGTRKRVTRWRTGFIRIALECHVPILLAVIDGANREIRLTDTFTPTGDIEADLRAVKDYYAGVGALYPEKFTTDDE